MPSIGYLRMLMRYKAWANRRLYQSIFELPEKEIIARRQIVFGSILRTLNHVYAMDLVWQAHLEGKPHTFSTRNPETCPAFSELRDTQQRIDDWYVNYTDELQPEAGEVTVNFTFIGGGSGSMSRCDILLHVVNHTTYHRGHVADMIYQIPAKPPTTDLPVFLRDYSG